MSPERSADGRQCFSFGGNKQTWSFTFQRQAPAVELHSNELSIAILSEFPGPGSSLKSAIDSEQCACPRARPSGDHVTQEFLHWFLLGQLQPSPTTKQQLRDTRWRALKAIWPLILIIKKLPISSDNCNYMFGWCKLIIT